MTLYHGSNTANIKILEPRQADHARPYVYMTTIDVVAAFYLCNAVERPYYWFPYGFESNSIIPVYHELYPNALKKYRKALMDTSTKSSQKKIKSSHSKIFHVQDWRQNLLK